VTAKPPAAASPPWGADLTPLRARAELHTFAERAPAEALVLVAAALRFGPPGRAVASNPSPASEEPGDGEGTYSIRPEQGARERAHSACDHAFREVAVWMGRPLAATHASERKK
jgi:hypothetical protein